MKPTKKKKKLPYLTDQELMEPVKAVEITIHGEYFKRGEHRNEVYEEAYEAKIHVPAQYNMGHVKLQSNRYVKRHLNGVRVRTFFVDAEIPAQPVEKKYVAKDFISDMGLQDNARQKEMYLAEMEKKAAREEAEADGEYVPPEVTVEHRLAKDHGYSVPE